MIAIVNNTELPYMVIGKMIDDISNKNTGDTMYYGKVDQFDVKYDDVEYQIKIRYLKKYVEWTFSLLHESAKMIKEKYRLNDEQEV